MNSKRLVCIVEGDGEVEAFPNLCSRIRDLLKAWSWYVDPEPIRHPRGRLVDATGPAPRRPALRDGVERAVRLALARPAAGVLVTCDEDDDCAAVWGPSADAIIGAVAVGRAVMAVREYETWLLHSIPERDRRRAGLTSVESRRDAKGLMRLFVPNYKPTIHQLAATRKLDIGRVWARSDSFDRLVTSLSSIFGVRPPKRPRP